MAKSEPTKTVNSGNSIGFSVKDILDLDNKKPINEDIKRNNLDLGDVKNQAIDFANAAAHMANASFFGQTLPASFYKYAMPSDLLNLNGSFS